MSEPAPKIVLIVDDHEINRRVASLFIQPLGWRIVMAANGAEAVDLAGVEAFNVILMDMLMPVMNGLDAARAIRAGTGPNVQTRIIALTALDDHRAEWQAVGVQDFLMKPLDPDLLIRTLCRSVTAAQRLSA